MNKKRITAAVMALCMALPTAAAASANALDLVKYGDANADGAVNLSDMITLTNHLHGKKTKEPLFSGGGGRGCAPPFFP